ncbi:hypothetical protein [Streptomyces sp. NBC_00878]|uniref:hypothetical protein n=1 Tax=Streptomyces sp. NBC_00878 TaxID=2975854 RepID=UPI0022529A31|nr:hypothetical protein [Streptomyces sp. NBC_00878]MCX4904743.1 hypothetical protein [Streptomyces sp. NBC_00878]
MTEALIYDAVRTPCDKGGGGALLLDQDAAVRPGTTLRLRNAYGRPQAFVARVGHPADAY